MTKIPNTNSWKPRGSASETLSTALYRECNHAEERLIQTLTHEQELTVDSFDSGAHFEASVRKEISLFLPRRYNVDSGRILDAQGLTAGQCDVIVFNDLWFPKVKSAHTDAGGGSMFPIEGVYAVGEVKQTLSNKTLDESMEKLVKVHRLSRPRTFANRLVENRESNSCPHGLTNPLFSFVFAGRLSGDCSIESIVERFLEICKSLNRLEVVHVLCVLGEGALSWAFQDPFRKNELRPALFMKDDLFHPIMPALTRSSNLSPFYFLLQRLQLHLYRSVLAPEDLMVAYAPDITDIAVPTSREHDLAPDKEWLDSLQIPCDENHEKN